LNQQLSVGIPVARQGSTRSTSDGTQQLLLRF
jgi:hypothetical protein